MLPGLSTKAIKGAPILAAQDKATAAQATRNSKEIIKAERELAALEAEKVSGLKPVKMNPGGRGRGRFRGVGRWRTRMRPNIGCLSPREAC